MFNLNGPCVDYNLDQPICSLACCPEVEAKPVCITGFWNTQNKEKENVMGYNNASAALVVQAAPTDPNVASRDHMLRRVDGLFWDKRQLSNFYHMQEDFPVTGQEMYDRITTGKMILHPRTNKDYDDSRIEWRDPAFPADKEGFEKARDLIVAAKQKAVDEITVLWPEQGLDALREFEKYDVTTEVPYTVH